MTDPMHANPPFSSSTGADADGLLTDHTFINSHSVKRTDLPLNYKTHIYIPFLTSPNLQSEN